MERGSLSGESGNKQKVRCIAAKTRAHGNNLDTASPRQLGQT